VGNKNIYLDAKQICKRYGHDLIFLSDNLNSLSQKCLFCEDMDFAKLISSKFEVILNIPENSYPVPYYIDIYLMNLSNDKTVNHDHFNDLLGLEKNKKYKKCTVFIPCMNREKNLIQSLETWLCQTYPNIQIVIIDYSSEILLEESIRTICDSVKKEFSNKPDSDADVVLLRINNQKHFNICHAYNYAIKRTETDIVSFACADSVPWNFYIETCVNLLSKNNFTQIHWGLQTIMKDNWSKLNGHQEFIVGWGAEDDDFRTRAILMGLEAIILPSKMVFQIPHKHENKGTYRQIKDISESSLTNMARFQQYIAHHGFVANYGKETGNDKPVEYIPDREIPLPTRMYCFQSSKLNKENPEQNIKYNKEFDLFYIISKTEVDMKKIVDGPFYHFFIHSDCDISKILYAALRNIVKK